jgi:MFS family permease
VQLAQELGGLAGRFVLAYLAIRIVSRRKLLRVFQLPGLFIVPFVFCTLVLKDYNTARIGMFMAGFFTVAQFSFWGNYLPRMYPTYLRGTGESFAANIGGRMLGTSAALLTTTFANSMFGANAFEKLAYSAATVALIVYAIGFLSSFWLPEPQQEKLPD